MKLKKEKVIKKETLKEYLDLPVNGIFDFGLYPSWIESIGP